MGQILDTDDEFVGLERRSVSYNVLDLTRTFPDSGPGKDKTRSEHIFANADGEIEMSGDYLHRLVYWFEKHPDERKRLADMYLEACAKRGVLPLAK